MNEIYDSHPPRLSLFQIEKIAENLIFEHIPDIFDELQPTPIALLIEKYLGLELDYKRLSRNNEVLGAIAFNDGTIEVYDEDGVEKYDLSIEGGTILVDSSLLLSKNIGRERFTMGHETGHWVLHRDLCGNMFRCVENNNTSRKLITNRDWFEWQADAFSSSILMPRKPFVKAFYDFYSSMKGSNYLFRKSEQTECLNYISEQLVDVFKVSVVACKIRIKKIFGGKYDVEF